MPIKEKAKDPQSAQRPSMALRNMMKKGPVFATQPTTKSVIYDATAQKNGTNLFEEIQQCQLFFSEQELKDMPIKERQKILNQLNGLQWPSQS